MPDSASEIKEPILRQVYDYWRGKCRDGAIPDRADLNPAEMTALLPHIFMMDIVDVGARFRYRLVGTEIVFKVGFDATGQFLDEVVGGDYLEHMRTLFLKVVTTRKGVYSSSTFQYPEREHVHTARLYLPLTNGGDAVAIIFAGQVIDYGGSLDQHDFVAVIEDVEKGDMSPAHSDFVLES